VKVCVVGAGAIGGYLACRLAIAGNDVSVLARRAHREAIRRNGLSLVDQHGQAEHARVRCAGEDGAGEGQQDVVVLASRRIRLPKSSPKSVHCSATTR